jgi:hypothetical protein
VHAGLNPVTNDVFDVIGGLVPDDPTCVAPSGMRTGGTGAPGPTPSGDVLSGDMPSGDVPSGDCAKEEPQLNRTAAAVTITKRVIVGSTLS